VSLNNLAALLPALGRLEDGLMAAEQAVEIRRRLAKHNPTAYEKDLATSLISLSSVLSTLGRRDESERTIQEAALIRGAE
jgi:tetratricopeptide (TPR) repeat protein